MPRKHINTISIHNLIRLRTPNVKRSNEGKWFRCQKMSRNRQYAIEAIMDAEYANLSQCTNISAQAEPLLHSLEQAARGIGLDGNSDKGSCASIKMVPSHR